MRLIDADCLKEKGRYDDFDVFVVDYDDIKNAPTIDTVKHGRWIEHHSVRGVYYSCSNCKAEGYGRYCQNCGAKMTYEEDGHDDHL